LICDPCSETDTQFSPDHYLFIALGGLLCAMIGMYWYYKWREYRYGDTPTDSTSLSRIKEYLEVRMKRILIKLRIVITTYQIVSTIPASTQVPTFIIVYTVYTVYIYYPIIISTYLPV
jgi:hypothetical protein